VVVKYTTGRVFESCSRSDYGISLTGTNSPELGPTDVAEADSVQGSERRRYNVTTPVIGIYVDFILFASAICVSKRLGSD